MKRILFFLTLIVLSLPIFAQSQSEIELLCQKAIVSAKNGDFAPAKQNYDAAISIIEKQPNSDLILAVPEDLSEYIIVTQAKTNPEEAQKCALTLLELQMHCLSYCATQGYFQSKEDYVDNISVAMIGMGYTMADAGLLKAAEECISAGVAIYPQSEISTPDYPMAYERFGYFYSEYCQDYLSQLNCQYEGFKVSASLYGYDVELTQQIFSRLATVYAINFAFLAFVGENGERFQTNDLKHVPYEQLIKLTEQWDRFRSEIVSAAGDKQFQALLNVDPINLNGEPLIRFGSKSWDLFYRALAALHYSKIEDYETHIQDLLDSLSDCDDVMAYSRDLITSLRNHNQVNLAFDLYDRVANKVAARKDLVELVNDMAGELALAYGFYDKAWTYVKDLETSTDSVGYCNKEAHLRRLSLLGSLYRVNGDYQKNLEVSLKAVDIADADSMMVPASLRKMLYNNLSVAYTDIKEKEIAFNSINKAIDLGRSIAIQEGQNPDDPKSLLWPVTEYGNLADLYIDSKDYESANRILQDCLTFYKHNYPTSSRLKNIYYSLMYVAGVSNDFEKMRMWANESYNQSLSAYLSQSHGMTKIQRTDFWRKMDSNSLEIFSNFALENDSFVELAYNSALIQKGFLLKYDGIISDNISNSNDVELIQAYNAYKLAEATGSHEKYALEDKVMRLYSKHPEFIRNASYATWKDVQKTLVKGDVAIEFVKCCSDGKAVSYAALLLQPGWERPVVVRLSSERDMDALLAKGARAYLDNERFYSMIWGKIEPYLTGVKRIYFSPYGALSQLNIEVLQNGKGKPMNKAYDIHRVSSTADLYKGEATSYASATLFGGLNYDLDTDSMQSISRGYSEGQWFTSAPVEFNDGLTRKGWSYLPGTKKEVEQISEILDKESIKNVTIMADSGTEESFKALSGRSTTILHVATHGFYISEKQAERSNPSLLKKDDGDSHIYPLRRCGLMMSGGQHAWLGEDVPAGIDDGVLTAEEIAGLNLSGTDLLVLSACQTGLGEIGGDGVYGLQRGFKIAGVNTIIMSLWEVSDAATEVLMTKFYSLLAKGKGKREAFDAAVEAVKKEYESPEYWAAFIMLD